MRRQGLRLVHPTVEEEQNPYAAEIEASKTTIGISGSSITQSIAVSKPIFDDEVVPLISPDQLPSQESFYSFGGFSHKFFAESQIQTWEESYNPLINSIYAQGTVDTERASTKKSEPAKMNDSYSRDTIDAKFETLEQKMLTLETKLDGKLDLISEKVSGIHTRVEDLSQSLNTRIGDLQQVIVGGIVAIFVGFIILAVQNYLDKPEQPIINLYSSKGQEAIVQQEGPKPSESLAKPAQKTSN